VRKNILSGRRQMKKRARRIPYKRKRPERVLRITILDKTMSIPMIFKVGERR
jgi:hypothetical protein